MTISPEQSRASRAWLGWSQGELAKLAGVSVSTVKDFETGQRVPFRNNLETLRRVIEAAGLLLTFDESGRATGIQVGAGRSADQSS